MAKQRYGINDGYRGTVGTVIGYMWRGRWCLRARPRSVRNPRTEKQQHNRELFKQMVFLASAFKQALRKGMHHVALAEHLTECNLFVKRNKECFALSQEGKLDVKWEQLIISEGELATPIFIAPTPTPPCREGMATQAERTTLQNDNVMRQPVPSLEGGVAQGAGVGATMTFSFLPHAEGERACGDDEVYLWAFCPEAGEGRLSTPAYRRSQQVSITLPETWQGKEVHLYGFAVDHKGTASPTTYIGVLEAEPIETQRTVSQENNDSLSSSIMPLPLGKTHHKNSVSSRPSSLTFSPDSESQKNQYRPGLRWSCP